MRSYGSVNSFAYLCQLIAFIIIFKFEDISIKEAILTNWIVLEFDK